jgi:hypothetical protein
MRNFDARWHLCDLEGSLLLAEWRGWIGWVLLVLVMVAIASGYICLLFFRETQRFHFLIVFCVSCISHIIVLLARLSPSAHFSSNSHSYHPSFTHSLTTLLYSSCRAHHLGLRWQRGSFWRSRCLEGDCNCRLRGDCRRANELP